MDFCNDLLVTVLISSLNLSLPAVAQNSHEDYLHAHNVARAQVGVQPLVWDNTVAYYAQRYADQRVADCYLEHSGGPYGENIAESGDPFSALDAVNMWVGEKPFYDYGSNSCVGDECLHYTQVVWICANGGWFVTCNYDPSGNCIGERPY